MSEPSKMSTPPQNSESDSAPGKADGKQPKKNEILEFIKTILWMLTVVILLRGSVVEAFRIPSGSMIPTLKIGDHILVTKFSYGFRLPFVRDTLWEFDAPERGDIVVFTRPDDPATINEDDSKKNIIKRVIGIAGDTIEVRGRDVFINGERSQEADNIRWDQGGIRSFGPVKVPEHHVFLMGDNRDHSLDSRFWTEPFIDLARVKGRAHIIYWSWDSLSRIGTLVR